MNNGFICRIMSIDGYLVLAQGKETTSFHKVSLISHGKKS